jgi:phosphoserine aminotransferase
LIEKTTVPLIADCSSNLLSKPIDITKYGCVFAGAQKNFGIAGLTLVIIRDDLLDYSIKECPSTMNYKIQAGNNSLYQTPPTFGVYMSGLIFEWLQKNGGLEGFGKVNKIKSELIYDTIKESNGFYRSLVDSKYKSRVTIPFRIFTGGQPNEKLEKEFLEQADKMYNLKELKGHRSVGGIRAAIYNALSLEEIRILCNFMNEFKQSHS